MTGTETPPRWDLTPIFPGLDDRSFSLSIEGIYGGVDRLVARLMRGRRCMTGTETPPRWDLTPIFRGASTIARSRSVDRRASTAAVDRLVARFDEQGIGEIQPRPMTDADVALLDGVLTEINDIQQQLRPVSTFLYGLTTTDSRDDKAAANMVELQTRTAALGPLMKRLGSWLAALEVDGFVARSETAEAHAFALRKAAEGVEFQMNEAEESLAAELAPSGSLAWQRLHGDVSSQLMVDVAGDEGTDGDGAWPRDTPGR